MPTRSASSCFWKSRRPPTGVFNGWLPLTSSIGGRRPTHLARWAALGISNFILTGHGEPAPLAGAALSSSFFRLLGNRMELGRGFLDEEDQPGKDLVVVLSYGVWQNRLSGKPDVLGTTVTLNDLSYTVVGVLAPDFELVTNASRNQPDVWVPLALDMQKLSRG